MQPFTTKQKNKFRHIGYGLIILIFFALETTQGLFPRFFGAPAMLLMLAMVCIAMFEQEIYGAAIGAVVGILLDVTSLNLPYFNALTFMIIGTAVGIISRYFMRNMLSSAFILAFGAMLLYNLVEWIFFYVLRGIDRAGFFFLRFNLVSIFYSLIFLLPIYFIVRRFAMSKS